MMTLREALRSVIMHAHSKAIHVQHPIQDQTPQQIAGREDAVAEEIVTRLTATG
jgi:hypothetical protein